MVIASDIKKRICSLFEVIDDEAGVQRVITPLAFSAGGDFIVVRVRPNPDGSFLIDENGEAAMLATMSGGDTESDAVVRWADELRLASPVSYQDELLSATAHSESEIAPLIFRVADAAQQLFALAVTRLSRQTNDFKARVAQVFEAASHELDFSYQKDVELPIAGGMQADFYIPAQRPLIVIAASSLPRLLEAEIIHMQYQLSKLPGTVVAVAESQNAVGKKQFERANYYTDKTVSFDANNMRRLIAHHLTFAQLDLA